MARAERPHVRRLPSPTAPAQSDGQLDRQRVEALYRALPLALATTILNALVVTVVLSRQVEAWRLLAWLVPLLAVSAWRGWEQRRYRREAHPVYAAWQRRFLCGVALAGPAWGLSGLLLVPVLPLPYQVFVVFVLGGMGVGGVVSLAGARSAYPLFLLPAMVPATLWLALDGGGEPMRLAMGLMLAVFILSLLFLARRTHDGLVHSLELGLRNQDLVDELRASNHALRESNRELEAFAYTVAHDLRAPLRAMDGFSLALLEDCGEMVPAQDRAYLVRIRSNAERMDMLIDDLLTLSRVTRAESRPATVSLTRLAWDLAGELTEAAPEREVSWRIADGLLVECDPYLLRVLLHNLMGNAWKFTALEPHARIEVGTCCAGRERCYYVRDNGVGFDMTFAARLSQDFYRLHSPADFEGAGIGLATAHRVVQRFGGRLWAHGAVGRGAAFYFTLPDCRATACDAVPCPAGEAFGAEAPHAGPQAVRPERW